MFSNIGEKVKCEYSYNIESYFDNLERLDSANDNISEEVARSNAISQIANTYIK